MASEPQVLDPAPDAAPTSVPAKPAGRPDPKAVMLAALGNGGTAVVIVGRVLAALEAAGWRFVHRDDERHAVSYRVTPAIDGETL